MGSSIDRLANDVFITDALRKRVPKRIDHARARSALLDLASEMVRDPEGVLPRYVDLALQETRASSAGLSLHEEPSFFRWRHTRGVLWNLEGGSTPRDDSPCGVVLDRNEPLLTRYPERLYDCLTGILIPELLLVPLHVGGEDPFGTLWVLSDREPHFDSGDAQLLLDLASFVGAALHASRRAEWQTSKAAAQLPKRVGGLAKWQERRAKEVIVARLDSKLSVVEIADACGLSVSHFTRAFQQSTGLSPHQWLTERRIERAQSLIRNVELPLSEIAISCGFADQSHFTRVFTGVVGKSPGAWRRLS
jgi:AraC-like DNA-binding protein